MMARNYLIICSNKFSVAVNMGLFPRRTSPSWPRWVYITLSKACSCTLELCRAGDIIVGNVFTGERKGLLKRIDYARIKKLPRCI